MRRMWPVVVTVLLLVGLSIFLYLRITLVFFNVVNKIPGYNFRVSTLAGNLFLYSQGYKTNFKNINIIFTTEGQYGVRATRKQATR